MQAVSQAWKTEQNKKLIEAESFVELTLNVSDPEVQADAEATDNGHEAFSNIEQAVDWTETPPIRYSTLELNLWGLDGKSSILPNEPPYGENGYIGNALSGQDGSYASPPAITIYFSKVYQTILPGLTITWGSAYEGEYADTFRVKAFNGTTQISSYTITGNTDISTVFSGDLQGYNKITIEILKWSKPYRRARIENILIGIETTFTKSDFFQYTHSMFVDPLSASLPKTEIVFEIKNLNGEYNPDNPQGAYKYLIDRQRVTARYGYKLDGTVEWIKGGTFYLSEWDCPQNGITATFTARDALEYMNELYTGPSSGTLMQIALSALQQAELPAGADGEDPWILDNSLSNISAAFGADLSKNTIAEVLQYVANAGCCVFYQDRDGKLRIGPLPSGATDYRIDRFNSYENSEISLTKQLKAVNVNDGQSVLSVGTVGEIQPVYNPLVSEGRAQTVAQWVANYLKERRTLSGSFRADPRLDPMDRVTNENQFSESVVLVTQIEYIYNGAFKGNYQARSGV